MDEREIPNHWKGRCFSCSQTNTKGLGLRFWLSEHGCYTRCTIPEYLCGIDGLAHGGMIALLFDEVAEWTMIGRLGKMGMTREISVRYLKPVPTNTEILVEGQIINQNDKNVVVRSTIHSADDELLAESESNWVLASLSTIAKLSAVDELTLQEFLAKYP
ncbi:MAG: PaaI family thioesterase [Proteobacteria bacterium]|nr:PaaI family thioesterase [Pseudomonadota bacterium]